MSTSDKNLKSLQSYYHNKEKRLEYQRNYNNKNKDYIREYQCDYQYRAYHRRKRQPEQQQKQTDDGFLTVIILQ